jgi:hypothetical protein
MWHLAPIKYNKSIPNKKISFWKILLNGEGPFVALTLRELYSISDAIIRLKGLLSFPCDVCRQAG